MLHVGTGGEINVKLAGAADGFRAHPVDANDGAYGLFERLSDLNIHVGDSQGRNFGDHADARKGDLGVDTARHAQGAVDAASRQQGRGQYHGTQIRSSSRGKV